MREKCRLNYGIGSKTERIFMFAAMPSAWPRTSDRGGYEHRAAEQGSVGDAASRGRLREADEKGQALPAGCLLKGASGAVIQESAQNQLIPPILAGSFPNPDFPNPDSFHYESHLYKSHWPSSTTAPAAASARLLPSSWPKTASPLSAFPSRSTPCGAAAATITAAGGKAKALRRGCRRWRRSGQGQWGSCSRNLEKIDILVNNAGITRDGLLARMSDDDWNAVRCRPTSRARFTGRSLPPAGLRRAALRWGRIVNIASVAGLVGNAGQANLRRRQGRPPPVLLESHRPGVRQAQSVTAKRRRTRLYQDRYDLRAARRGAGKQQWGPFHCNAFGQAAVDIANATAVCSEEANYITAQVFTVDGGMTM